MAKEGLGDHSSAKSKFSRNYPGLGFGAELSGQIMLPTLGMTSEMSLSHVLDGAIECRSVR